MLEIFRRKPLTPIRNDYNRLDSNISDESYTNINRIHNNKTDGSKDVFESYSYLNNQSNDTNSRFYSSPRSTPTPDLI